MISVSLAIMAALLQNQVAAPGTRSPTDADKAALRQIATKCQLPAGTLYFIQYDVPQEPVIHMSRAVEENKAQQLCVLNNLPTDFMERFGLDSWMPPRP